MNKTVYILILGFVFVCAGCASQPVQDEDTISVWHWMGDRQDTFDELARRYEDQTGVKVIFDLYAPSEAYTQKVKAGAQTRTLPDIFGILGDTRDFASFVKSGYVADITDLMSKGQGTPWRDTLFGRALAVNSFESGNEYGVKPGIYGVPLDVTNVQLIYNREIFRQAGLDPDKPPVTWDEFIETARVLRRKNIPVLVGGFGEIWLIDILSTSLAMNIMGEQKVFDTYSGEVPYTDPDWIRVLELFEEMTREEVFVTGTVTMVNKTAEQTFANGRAAFAWNGSWCVNVYRGMNPNLDYSAILPPRITQVHDVRIWGGAGNSLMINAQSPRKDSAVAFLKWMSEKDQQTYFAKQTRNIPANRVCIRNIPDILAQFADDMDNTFHLNTFPVHELPQVVEAWDKGIQSIMIGEKSPAEVAREVQEVKQREQERLRRRRT